MGLTVTEIAAIVREIAPALSRGKIQKIYQPSPHVITFEIRKPGQTLSLLLSADPEAARLHLLSRHPDNPATPPPFCQRVRAHLQGARLESIEQLAGDRIVRLRMATQEGTFSLVAELIGRKADVFLLDGDEKILASLRGMHVDLGEIYHAPPLAEGRPRPGTEPEPVGAPNQRFPISAAIESRYQQWEEERARSHLLQARAAEIRRAQKKITRRLTALEADLDKAARYREYARYGELLKAHLGQIAKGEERVAVVDYFDPGLPEIVLPLDPSKNPRRNMEEYFRKHQKYLAAEREIRPRLQAAEKELSALRAESTHMKDGTWEPVEQAGRAVSTSPGRSEAQAAKRGSFSAGAGQGRGEVKGPFRRFLSADGLQILVGRNARENEELTFGLARSHDLWFHAHGTPGSHVVLRVEKGADPTPEAIRDAATLALLYSDLRKSGKGEVIFTKRSHVRKVKGKSPGTVTVTQEKTLFVELDQARLRRLKDQRN